MRTVVLTLILDLSVPVEAEKITPDTFAGLSVEQIKALDVWHGNRAVRLSDIFEVNADGELTAPEETRIMINGDISRVKRIGEGMAAGAIEASGSIGMHAGNNMRGGSIHIRGNAGDWLGREMRGGNINVDGSAGNYAGGGYRGEKCGMRGGEIHITGSAGDFLGEHLCGGTIRVGGDTGDFAGAMNQGGTIWIGGDAHLPGAEMTKGMIAVTGRASVLPSFQDSGVVEIEGKRYRKYLGDLVESGKGELYVADGHLDK